MNVKPSLKLMVQQNMSDLIADYFLALAEVSESEVLLMSEAYVIDIVADRDGVSLLYFDTTTKPLRGYNLFLFLANKRRGSLVFSAAKPQTTYTEFIDGELSSLAQHIRNAGKDILGGSKDWIKSYSWPALRPNGDVASKINEQKCHVLPFARPRTN